MSNSPLKYLVVLGSVRQERLCDRVGKFVKTYLEKQGHSVDLLDPEVIELPLLKQPLHFYPDQSKAPQVLHDLNAKVLNADCLIIVTAEYNRQLPPALLNFLDHIPPQSFSFRTSGIVSYSLGPFGGSIAANNARSYLTELGCLPVSPFFAIPLVQQALDLEGNPLNDRMISGIESEHCLERMDSDEPMHCLGVDLGTTTVKTCIVDSKRSIIATHSVRHAADILSGSSSSAPERYFHEQLPERIIHALFQCLTALPSGALAEVRRIAIAGQMHGVVLWNSNRLRELFGDDACLERFAKLSGEQARAVCSRLITWQDQRASEEFLRSIPSQSRFDAIVGQCVFTE